MSKFYNLMVALLISVSALAQSPEKMSYQAVIRNAGGDLVVDQVVGMRISILQDNISGIAVYVETQMPTTNVNGLVSLEIGAGTTSDDFSSIDWGGGTYFIKTETDPTGGTNYTITGTSQLLSVPYALHSKSSDSADSIGNDYYFQASTGFGSQQISGNNFEEFVQFQTEISDPSNSYDIGTSTFTAPADGVYYFSSFVTVSPIPGPGTNLGGAFFGFILNNASYPDPAVVPTTVISPGMYITATVVSVSGILQLNLGDTIKLGISGASDGESFNINYSGFSGYKIR